MGLLLNGVANQVTKDMECAEVSQSFFSLFYWQGLFSGLNLTESKVLGRIRYHPLWGRIKLALSSWNHIVFLKIFFRLSIV